MLAAGAALFLPSSTIHRWIHGKDHQNVGPVVDLIARTIQRPKLRTDPHIQSLLRRFSGPQLQIIQQTAQINAGVAANAKFLDTRAGKKLDHARSAAWQQLAQRVDDMAVEDQAILRINLAAAIKQAQTRSNPPGPAAGVHGAINDPPAHVAERPAVLSGAPFSAAGVHGAINDPPAHVAERPAVLSGAPFSAAGVHGAINDPPAHVAERPAVLSGAPFSAAGVHGAINDPPAHVTERPAVLSGAPFSAAGVHGAINDPPAHVAERPAVLSGAPFSAAGVHGAINDPPAHVTERPAVLSGAPFSAAGVHGAINDPPAHVAERPAVLSGAPFSAAGVHGAINDPPAHVAERPAVLSGAPFSAAGVHGAINDPPAHVAERPAVLSGAPFSAAGVHGAINDPPAHVAERPAAAAARPTASAPIAPPSPDIPSTNNSGGEQGITFDFDRSNLDSAAMAAIHARALQIKRTGFHHGDGHRIRIEGDTDAVGANSYNIALSRRRATGVAAALKAELKRDGVDVTDTDFDIVAAGKSHLAVQTQGRSRENRRATIEVTDDHTPNAGADARKPLATHAPRIKP